MRSVGLGWVCVFIVRCYVKLRKASLHEPDG